MFVEKSPMESFNESVALRPAYLGIAMIDALQLQKELVWMFIRSATEFPPIVRENGMNDDMVLFEERQDVVVHDLDSSQRQFIGVESGPCEPGIAIKNRLEVDFPDTL